MTIDFFCEKSGVYLDSDKAVCKQMLRERLVAGSRGLMQAVQCFVQKVDLIFVNWVSEARWLTNINLLIHLGMAIKPEPEG